MEDGVAEQVEIQAKYQGYIARQQEEVGAARGTGVGSAACESRLQRRARAVEGSTAEACAPAAGNPRSGGAYLRCNAGGDFAFAGASEAHASENRNAGSAAQEDAHDAAGRAGTRARRTRARACRPARREKLLAYLDLLAKWNKTYNLTAIRDPLQDGQPPPARFARRAARTCRIGQERSRISARAAACPGFRSPSQNPRGR